MSNQLALFDSPTPEDSRPAYDPDACQSRLSPCQEPATARVIVPHSTSHGHWTDIRDVCERHLLPAVHDMHHTRTTSTGVTIEHKEQTR